MKQQGLRLSKRVWVKGYLERAWSKNGTINARSQIVSLGRYLRANVGGFPIGGAGGDAFAGSLAESRFGGAQSSANAAGGLGGAGFKSDGLGGGTATADSTATSGGAGNASSSASATGGASGDGLGGLGGPGAGGAASAHSTATSIGAGNASSSATAIGGASGNVVGGLIGPGAGGAASADSAAMSSGAGNASTSATATGGAGGDVTGTNAFVGGDGGAATATANTSAAGGGTAVATAAATAGAGKGPGTAGAANATSSARTAKGALAQAQSTAVGSSGQAQSTAKTNLGGVSVMSSATAPTNGSTATTNAIAQGGAGQAFVNPGQAAYAFSTALPDKAYAATLIGGASHVASALLGPRDAVFGTAILGANTAPDGGESNTYSASSTFDFGYGGDLRLGLIDDQQSGFANGLGFQSMEFTIMADGVEVLDVTFGSLAIAESFFQGDVIDLGANFGPNIDLTFGYTLVADGPGGFGFELAIGGAVPEPSTWAMMLVGFAGLGYAGYRRAREPRAA